MRVFALAGILLFGLLSAAATPLDEPTWQEQSNIPPWVWEMIRATEFSQSYSLSARLNPFLVQGDFNGDSRLDAALLVRRKSSRESGIAIFHAGAAEAIIVGAGNEKGPRGADMRWMNAWRVYSKGPVGRGADGTDPPILLGDALLAEKLEASSGIIYWSGSSYKWYHQGD